MLFKNEKLRKFTNEQNFFERDYVKLLATSPELKWLREDLESDIKNVSRDYLTQNHKTLRN